MSGGAPDETRARYAKAHEKTRPVGGRSRQTGSILDAEPIREDQGRRPSLRSALRPPAMRSHALDWCRVPAEVCYDVRSTTRQEPLWNEAHLPSRTQQLLIVWLLILLALVIERRPGCAICTVATMALAPPLICIPISGYAWFPAGPQHWSYPVPCGRLAALRLLFDNSTLS